MVSKKSNPSLTDKQLSMLLSMTRRGAIVKGNINESYAELPVVACATADALKRHGLIDFDSADRLRCKPTPAQLTPLGLEYLSKYLNNGGDTGGAMMDERTKALHDRDTLAAEAEALRCRNSELQEAAQDRIQQSNELQAENMHFKLACVWRQGRIEELERDVLIIKGTNSKQAERIAEFEDEAESVKYVLRLTEEERDTAEKRVKELSVLVKMTEKRIVSLVEAQTLTAKALHDRDDTINKLQDARLSPVNVKRIAELEEAIDKAYRRSDRLLTANIKLKHRVHELEDQMHDTCEASDAYLQVLDDRDSKIAGIEADNLKLNLEACAGRQENARQKARIVQLERELAEVHCDELPGHETERENNNSRLSGELSEALGREYSAQQRIAELEREIAEAQGRPTIADVTAEQGHNCGEMENGGWPDELRRNITAKELRRGITANAQSLCKHAERLDSLESDTAAWKDILSARIDGLQRKIAEAAGHPTIADVMIGSNLSGVGAIQYRLDEHAAKIPTRCYVSLAHDTFMR